MTTSSVLLWSIGCLIATGCLSASVRKRELSTNCQDSAEQKIGYTINEEATQLEDVTDMDSLPNCLLRCCETESCNAAVINMKESSEEKPSVQCVLFTCTDEKCLQKENGEENTSVYLWREKFPTNIAVDANILEKVQEHEDTGPDADLMNEEENKDGSTEENIENSVSEDDNAEEGDDNVEPMPVAAEEEEPVIGDDEEQQENLEDLQEKAQRVAEASADNGDGETDADAEDNLPEENEADDKNSDEDEKPNEAVVAKDVDVSADKVENQEALDVEDEDQIDTDQEELDNAADEIEEEQSKIEVDTAQEEDLFEKDDDDETEEADKLEDLFDEQDESVENEDDEMDEVAEQNEVEDPEETIDDIDNIKVELEPFENEADDTDENQTDEVEDGGDQGGDDEPEPVPSFGDDEEWAATDDATPTVTAADATPTVTAEWTASATQSSAEWTAWATDDWAPTPSPEGGDWFGSSQVEDDLEDDDETTEVQAEYFYSRSIDVIPAFPSENLFGKPKVEATKFAEMPTYDGLLPFPTLVIASMILITSGFIMLSIAHLIRKSRNERNPYRSMA